jgi:hypothetical protein
MSCFPPSTDDSNFNRDFPDDSRSGVNIRVFPAFLQDSREVGTAISASGSPKGGWRLIWL